MKFYLSEDFRFKEKPNLPLQFTQYSTEEIEISLPFNKNDDDGISRSIVVSVIRPDGYKTNEMFAEFAGEDLNNEGFYIWKSGLTPYHTSIMPGTNNTGSLIIGFMLKEFKNDTLIDVLSSPITKITVHRGIEPNQEFLPYSVQDDFGRRINAITEQQYQHDFLTLASRSKPNQHPIESISGLSRKVEVAVSDEEPTKGVDTWFDTVAVDDEVPVYTRWETLSSTPIIHIGADIRGNNFEPGEATRLVVIGNLAGEMYRQEFHSGTDGTIEGEALLKVSKNYADIASVEFEIVATDFGSHQVIRFKNTGNVELVNFTALGIEVYR